MGTMLLSICNLLSAPRMSFWLFNILNSCHGQGLVINCMQDTFACARTEPLCQARDDRVSCIQRNRKSSKTVDYS